MRKFFSLLAFLFLFIASAFPASAANTTCAIDKTVSDAGVTYTRCPFGDTNDYLLGQGFNSARLEADVRLSETPIFVHNLCRYTDARGLNTDPAKFIPFSTTVEWQSFISNPPAHTDVVQCCIPRSMRTNDIPQPTEVCTDGAGGGYWRFTGLVDPANTDIFIAKPESTKADALLKLVSGVTEDADYPITYMPIQRDNIGAVLPKGSRVSDIYLARWLCSFGVKPVGLDVKTANSIGGNVKVAANDNIGEVRFVQFRAMCRQGDWDMIPPDECTGFQVGSEYTVACDGGFVGVKTYKYVHSCPSRAISTVLISDTCARCDRTEDRPDEVQSCPSGQTGQIVYSVKRVYVSQGNVCTYTDQKTLKSNTCTAIINGQCGAANGVASYTAPAANLCAAGNATAVTGTGPWAWTCVSTNGGTTASCAAPKKEDGVCGPSNGQSFYTAPSTGLCSIGSASAVTGSGPWNWTCSGVNGGAQASCSATVASCAREEQLPDETQSCPSGQTGQIVYSVKKVYYLDNRQCVFRIEKTLKSNTCTAIINGQCGAANGVASYTAPSSGLCAQGNATAVTGTGPWAWTCVSTNGGTTDSCAAPKKVDGVCGPSNGGEFYTAPSTGLCSVGTASAVTGNGPWSWTCSAQNGGVVPTCTANAKSCAREEQLPDETEACPSGQTGLITYSVKKVYYVDNGQCVFRIERTLKSNTCTAVINGQCGAANGVAVYRAPTVGLCAQGTASAVAGTGPWSWTCASTNGGTTASCAAPKKEDGLCGPSNGQRFYTKPTTGLCSVGSPSEVTGTGPWNWVCSGVNGGVQASCSANVQSCAREEQLPDETENCPSGQTGLITYSVKKIYYVDNGQCVFRIERTLKSNTCTAIINGQCGAANGVPTDTAPTTGLCAQGTASAVTGTGPWNWTCASTNGGTTASCSAPKKKLTCPAEQLIRTEKKACPAGQTGEQVYEVYRVYKLEPCGKEHCDNGDGYYEPHGKKRRCMRCVPHEERRLKSDTCTAVAQCGPANGVAVATKPTTGLCAVGLPSEVTGTGPWNWTCNNVRSIATCSAPKKPTCQPEDKVDHVNCSIYGANASGPGYDYHYHRACCTPSSGGSGSLFGADGGGQCGPDGHGPWVFTGVTGYCTISNPVDGGGWFPTDGGDGGGGGGGGGGGD